MLKCKDVVKILSSDAEKSWVKRFEIHMHLFICHHCRKYAKQLEHIKSSVKNRFQVQKDSVSKEEIHRIESEVLRKLK